MLKLTNISKTYTIGSFSQNALDQVNLAFRKSEFVAVLGPSGGGKTTLLNVIGGLDRADEGDLIINGESTKAFRDYEWDMYRNHSIGFIFQNHNLISHLTILQNVEMGLSLGGMDTKEKHDRAIYLLNRVGLADHIHKRPNQLSGGQSQRVAIARALANNPDIILADEPTGSLDSETGIQILDMIKEIAKDKLVIMVTHDSEMAYKYATRVVEIKDGQIISDSNPIEAQDENKGLLELKKTSMSYATAFISSINNIRTKLGRTILTAFAGSIGIIGISLILSLSNGMQKEIDNFERETLSSYPISIDQLYIDVSSLLDYVSDRSDLESHPDIDYIKPYKSVIDENIKINFIDEDYVTYIERYLLGEGLETLAGYQFNYRLNSSLLADIDNDWVVVGEEKKVSSTTSFGQMDSQMPMHILPEGDIFNDNYELLGDSQWPVSQVENKYIEVLLSINDYNQIPEEQLEALGYDVDGFDDDTIIEYSDLIGREFKWFIGDYDKYSSDIDEAFTVVVSGVIRTQSESNISLFMPNGLVYTQDIEDELIKEYPQEQGGIKTIKLYPKDFESKDKVLAYLDAYNKGKTETQSIYYNDQASVFTSISSGIINAVSIVLIAFASISLVVSSIMIAIITYVSVIERTKEIGVLRALGARKKDISRVFNTENIIIGFSAGLVGIITTLILIIPINLILENLSDISNIAKLSLVHIVILIAISISLAFIAGLIPSRMAAKKDPVEALRSE